MINRGGGGSPPRLARSEQIGNTLAYASGWFQPTRLCRSIRLQKRWP